VIEPKRNKTRQLSLGQYEVHIAREGFASIRHRASGEIMHSRTAPMEEARRLYVEQSALAERLREPGDEVVIWDVGLGAAANAMAAIHCYEELAASGPVRPMRIISFENDLDSLKLARQLTDLFPYLRHSGPAGILEEGTWQSKQHLGLSWILVRGDFLSTMLEPPAPPDLIFYDMFSSKTCAEQWTLDTFKKLGDVCHGRAVELFTYTCSTSARVALLAAGFHVARGRNAGEKEETTIALTPEAFALSSGRRHELLSSTWLEKWNRSGAKFPADLATDERGSFEQRLRGHQQFAAEKSSG
jgi:queuine tRNA-ribosyltransferase